MPKFDPYWGKPMQTAAEYVEKATVHAAVYAAIKRGDLQRQPCVVCGAAWVHAHHEDYSKPLDVIWFCPAHHTRRHAALRRGVSLTEFLASAA